MASRKEEKERLRAQRLAAERAAQSGGRRRLMAGYVVAGILTVAVVAGLVAVIASGGSGSGTGNSCSEAHIKNSGEAPRASSRTAGLGPLRRRSRSPI